MPFPVAVRSKVSLALVAIGSLAAGLPRVASAQPPSAQHNITIDGSFGSPQILTGPNYAIGASVGQQRGSNLFHSFGLFGLATGESATFSGPAAISNVIGRVTGGSPSSINGKIQSTITGANLYLINPSGMVFGPNATVNVSGSFHASTADYLKMSDGAKFQATNPDGSTLSAAPPAAFGFLTASPAKISVNGSTLGPVPGTLGLVGGPVSIAGATLSAPAGTIHVASAAGTGEVPVDPRNTAALMVTSFGPVQITGGSKLDVSNPINLGSGGSVFIRSGALTINASTINADNYGTGAGGSLVLHGDSQVVLSNSTSVHAVALGRGSGAGVAISTAPSGVITADASTVQTGSVGSGNAGPLSVATGQLSLTNGASLTSSAHGAGSGGPIAITADSVLLDGGAALDPSTGIFSTTTGVAGGGSITVVAGQLSLTNGASLTSSAHGSGSGGPIAITADSVLLDGGAAMNQSTGISSTTMGAAGGGSITVIAGQLTLHNGAGVLAENFGAGAGGGVAVSVGGSLTVDSGASLGTLATGAGNAGDVSVSVAGPVTVDMSIGAAASILGGIGSSTAGTGKAGDVTVAAGALTIADYGKVASTTFGAGNAGDVSVNVSGMLSIIGPSQAQGDTGVAAESEDRTAGNSGTVNVSAGTISIDSGGRPVIGFVPPSFGGFVDTDDDFGGISVQAEGSGRAGVVTVASAGALTVVNGGVITAQTFGSNAGGAAHVTAQGPLTLSGLGSGIVASATPTASGNAGSVTVTAPQITITAGAEIASTTAGTGAGGSVTVMTPGALVLDGEGIANTQIAASATGPNSGPGGPVTVMANSLTVAGGAQIASTTAGPGKGGDIAVTVAGDVTLSGAGPQITARSTGSGDAGSVTVSAFRLLPGNGAAISTEAGISTASGGNITLSVVDLLYLMGSEITTSVKGETGNGGNITIASPSVVLDRSQIIAQAVEGHGGNITITADEFVASPDSIVSATSQVGISGTIEIIGPRVDLNGALVVLSSELRNAAAVLRNSCAAQGNRPQSSLVEAGRGGQPQDPDATLPALYIAGRDASPTLSTAAGPPQPVRTEQTTARLTMRCG